MAENVRVIVRCRPMNEKEIKGNCKCVVKTKNCVIETWDPTEGPAFPKEFTFDSVYDQNASTETVYNEICYPLVESTLEGYNSTIFVYGQTGCGKSYTMEGNPAVSEKGIIPRAIEHIFEAISVSTGVKYLALVSYLEIYNEQIRDLLVAHTKHQLSLKETPTEGVTVSGLTVHSVQSISECEHLLTVGAKNRMVGSTLMNQNSSRSHTIFTISIEQISMEEGGNECVRKGKLNLVDLAGSERQAKTGAVGDRLKEATKINLSLSALGNVISALVDGKARHIPYRDSKLTRLLQDSLGGNTRTLMIGCVSPSDRDYAETLSTLRYANRAKQIHNKPRVNEDPKDAVLREYKDEIERLRKLLENRNDKFDSPTELINKYQTEMEILKNLHENEKIEKENAMKQIRVIKEQYEIGEKLKPNKEEILERMERLKAAMIGGERADDKELSERHRRKKQEAERRASAIARVLAKVEMDEDREILQNQYKDISWELKMKTEALRRCRHKVKLLQKEIADIQAEFEGEREDYLETIRRSQKSVQLLEQIAEKMKTTLRKECNYRDLETIKEQAIWLEEVQRYKLPDLVIQRTKFPPAGRTVDIQTAPGRLENDLEEFQGQSSGILEKKIQISKPDDIIENYFKPKRATELLNESIQLDAARVLNKWKEYARNKPRSTDNLSTVRSPEINLNSSSDNRWICGSSLDIRKPLRLEALPSTSSKHKVGVKNC